MLERIIVGMCWVAATVIGAAIINAILYLLYGDKYLTNRDTLMDKMDTTAAKTIDYCVLKSSCATVRLKGAYEILTKSMEESNSK